MVLYKILEARVETIVFYVFEGVEKGVVRFVDRFLAQDPIRIYMGEIHGKILHFPQRATLFAIKISCAQKTISKTSFLIQTHLLNTILV